MFSGLEVAQTHPARRWTALASFTLQAALVAAALVYPILYPHSIADFARRQIFGPVALGQVRVEPSQPTSRAGGQVRSVIPIQVRPGTYFHNTTHPTEGPVAPIAPDLPYAGPASPIGVLDADPGPVARLAPQPAKPERVIRTSSMLQGMLVHRVEPQYPPIALAARVQGPVRINAVISRQGTIEQAQVVSGSPLLASAALSAVRQWRYKPYVLNNEPVEVETQITVNFVLGR